MSVNRPAIVIQLQKAIAKPDFGRQAADNVRTYIRLRNPMVRHCTALCIRFKASNNPPCIERDGSEREREHSCQRTESIIREGAASEEKSMEASSSV